MTITMLRPIGEIARTMTVLGFSIKSGASKRALWPKHPQMIDQVSRDAFRQFFDVGI
jgi:hypothetical protein